MELKVGSFIEDRCWNLQKLSQTIPDQLIQQVVPINIGDATKEDYAYWNITEDGCFSNGATWRSIQLRRPSNFSLQKVWNKNIPFKMSFLAWRLLQSKLPFNKVISRFGNEIVSTCHCCVTPKNETIQHVFCCSDAATHLWNYFGNPLGIVGQGNNIRIRMAQWWDIRSNNIVHKYIL